MSRSRVPGTTKGMIKEVTDNPLDADAGPWTNPLVSGSVRPDAKSYFTPTAHHRRKAHRATQREMAVEVSHSRSGAFRS